MPEGSKVVPFLSSNLVGVEDVTIGRLSSILDSAFIDHEEDEDGDLYLSEGLSFPIWIYLDGPRRFLHLVTHHEIDREPEADLTSRVYRMNAELIFPRFYLRGGVIFGDYDLSYEGGLSPRLLIRSLHRFATVFVEGLRLYGDHRAEPPLP